MLRRLTLGLFTLACAAAIAACSSGNTTVPSSGGQPGLGPNFVTNTLYVTNTTQNAIEIYTPSPSANATPQYQIGGSNTSLSGPQYLAFDSQKNLYATNFSAATGQASIQVYATYATGNVLPVASIALPSGVHAAGIAMIPGNGGFVVGMTYPGGFFTSLVDIYGALANGTAPLTATIAGSNTNLSNPSGVSVDKNKNIYVANGGNGKVTVYAMPTPAPTPSGTPTPTPAPTPTATPPTPTPAPTPTPSSNNNVPLTTITCAPGPGMPAPCMVHPMGLTLDGSGNLYVTDPDSGATPAVYIYTAAQVACAAPPCALNLTPSRFISGSNTKLVDPTDVAVDSTGTIYVLDAGNGPNTSMLLVFPAGASGNVAPATAVSLPTGTATGLALSP